MTATSKNVDPLTRAIIVQLTTYVALSNVVFVDFHGQEEGEDPDFDIMCQRQAEAKENLLQAIRNYCETEIENGAKRNYERGYNSGYIAGRRNKQA